MKNRIAVKSFDRSNCIRRDKILSQCRCLLRETLQTEKFRSPGEIVKYLDCSRLISDTKGFLQMHSMRQTSRSWDVYTRICMHIRRHVRMYVCSCALCPVR